MTAAELLALSRRELMELLHAGHPVDPTVLEDQQYNGISLGLPHFVERLTWKKFGKTFHRDPQTGVLRGWNVRMMQNDLDKPWQPRLRRGRPVTFGHYHVSEPTGTRPYDRGLLIDYSRGGRSPTPLRDPIVALEPGNSSLLLGWTYLALGARHIGTPSFFSLERDGPLRFIPR